MFPNLDFLSTTAADGREMYEANASFRHWDQRIWTARITKASGSYALTLSSTGCRVYTITSRNPSQLRTAATSFANLDPVAYERLIADAKPTYDHPRPDGIVVLQGQIVTARRAGYVEATRRPDVRWDSQAVSGLGRFDEQGRIVAFQGSTEIRNILTECCPAGCDPLVPDGINAMLTTAQRRGVQDLAANLLDEDDLEALMSGLDEGFHTDRPPAAPLRAAGQTGRVLDIDLDG